MKIYLSRFDKKRRIMPFFANRSHNQCSADCFETGLHPENKRKGAFTKIGLILFFILFSLTFSAYAQNITLKKTNTSLESVLKSIESQSKYVFFYKKAEIIRITNVSVDFKSIPLEEVLKSIFKDRDLEYQIFDKTIAIKKALHSDPNSSADSLPRKKSAILLKGKVVDENLLPIKNVWIKEPKVGTQTFTNANGEFKLQGGVSGAIIISAPGFSKKTVGYVDTTYLDIMMEMGNSQTIDLAEVNIQQNNIKENPTKFVNLENRTYMNLSQVLQGTIPGLSLQVVNVSTKTITSIDYASRNSSGVTQYVRYTVEDFLNYVGKTKGQAILDALLNGTNVPTSISNVAKLNTQTSVTNALVPEIRGASNFGSAKSNMLVVIDGFPQDGFPANYPMTNVESIEVIKDPKELIKWGSRAAGGAILIKSKSAKAGKIQLNYTGNFYFTPAPKFNRAQLKLANSATYLSYMRDVDSLLAIGTNYGASQFNLSPAKQLLRQKSQGLITKAQFNTKWDSLSRLDNESQLALLQQSSFNQNHSLTASGGNKIYKFTLIGNYIEGTTNNLNSKSNTYSFSLNNTFNLLNNKLRINWLINYSDAKTNTGNSFSPTSTGLDPYQMLLDNQGNYVYDYTTLSPTANQTIMAHGYKNYGVNILQDARINENKSGLIDQRTKFNMVWDLLPGLKWATSVYYTGKKNSNSMLYDAESSYARQLVDLYGQLNTNGVNFYVPYGDILNANHTSYDEWNVRSSLGYTKVLGKNVFNVTVGAGAASTNNTRPPYSILYGYNPTTNTGTPIYLPTPNTTASITNFYKLFAGTTSSLYPYALAKPISGDTSLSRSVNSNIAVDYNYGDRIAVSGIYNNVLSPLYGQAATYSVLSSYKGDVTGRIVKNWTKFLRDVLVSVGGEGLQMPNLPAQYSNIRYQQTFYNNYGIWVSGATPTQQQGQSSKTIYEKLTVALLDSTVVFNGAYNTQKINGNLISITANDVAAKATTTTNYLSAGMDLFLRRKLLNLHLDYAKSPEGQTQYNGTFNYYVSHESYFKSRVISDLQFNATLQEISPYQGLALMQGTNVAANGSYSQATNNDFTLLPPKNKTFEAHGLISLYDNKYSLDLRYYNQTSSGLNNNLSVLTDPSTGLSNQVTYSTITNSGVELFLTSALIKKKRFSYTVTLNGAHNTNMAKSVPLTPFTANSNYTTAVRDGYDVSNIWAPRWAGLNSNGDPQIYDKNGKITSTLDSATISGAIVKQGVTKAPWTGGFIQEARLGQFFTRVAFTINLGYVMRYYLPYPGSDLENSALIADRWRKPGDEAFTDIPRISTSGGNSYREFVARYSSNSILPADNIRLQEVMLGFNLPDAFLKKCKLGSFIMTFQVENVSYWARNKYNIDPATISSDGRIGSPLPRTYSCSISMNF